MIKLAGKPRPRLLSGLYKHALGRMLTWGAGVNDFAYPPGVWPPPTPARRYIREFLERYRAAIRGACVEFAPPIYRRDFGGGPDVAAYDIWSVVPGRGITIVADLERCPEIPDGRFDTIICTHVLSAVRRPWRAAQELRRVLSPGGVLLCTVPTVLQQYAPDPHDGWRITRDGLATLLEDFARVELHDYGNAATVAGSPYFLMEQHYSAAALARHDGRCPSVVAAAAWKSA